MRQLSNNRFSVIPGTTVLGARFAEMRVSNARSTCP